MNLDCLNDVITDNLAIYIDISDINSWNLNSGFTSVSLTKWAGATSDNINLYDFGLTEYDNGRTDRMYSGLTITPKDLNVTLYRIGYNNSFDAFTGDTQYDIYPISAVTTGSSVGNYFDLNGGYLQGFFKLSEYKFEQFPGRYNNGITIETLVKLYPESEGIFYLMGVRAEDKYNKGFSGETQSYITQTVERVPTGVAGQTDTVVTYSSGFSGIQTSEEHYLNSYIDEEHIKNAFSSWEDMTKTVPVTKSQSGNTKNNVIAFLLTEDKKLAYKYLDSNNQLVTNSSTRKITVTGWTMIDVVFNPYETIKNYDSTKANCYPRRKGDLRFFVNGREFWKLKDFDEFYFRGISNHREKQIGVPFNISWGGGSFGLKNSWHYDFRTIPLYTGQSQNYIINNLMVTSNPLDINVCITGDTGGSFNSLGLILSADTTTFYKPDNCDPIKEIPVTVLRIENTGNTGTTLYEYFIEYKEIIDSISNRDITLSADIYDTGIFKIYDDLGYSIRSSISLVAFGTEDIELQNQITYNDPLTTMDTSEYGPYPLYDHQIFEYEDGATGLLIDGTTGFPVKDESNTIIVQNINASKYITGTNKWNTIKGVFRLKENTGHQYIKVGLLIKSTEPLNDNFILFVKNFTYISADKLNKDVSKDNLLIQQNFDSSFIGGVQKLRVYDNGLNAEEILHNAKIELKNKPEYNYIVSLGGRLIYR